MTAPAPLVWPCVAMTPWRDGFDDASHHRLMVAHLHTVHDGVPYKTPMTLDATAIAHMDGAQRNAKIATAIRVGMLALEAIVQAADPAAPAADSLPATARHEG